LDCIYETSYGLISSNSTYSQDGDYVTHSERRKRTRLEAMARQNAWQDFIETRCRELFAEPRAMKVIRLRGEA